MTRRSGRARRRLPVLPAALALLTALATPAPLAAQIGDVRAADRTRNVAANALIGAGTAGVRALVARQPLRRALVLGAMGGAAQAAGKQVAGRGFGGSGALGRALSVAGISLGASASAPRTMVEVPVGPVLVALAPDTAAAGGTPSGRWRADWRVNLWSVATIGVELTRGSRLALGPTLSAGTPVLQRRDGDVRIAGGDRVIAGTAHQQLIVIAAGLDRAARREVLAHEVIHVLQFDAAGQLAAYPLERALVARLARAPLPRALRERVLPHVDLGVLLPFTTDVLGRTMPYARRPWEREAHLLTTGDAAPPGE